jgi:nucleoside-diphosphate-sugar epimerase
MRVLVTGSSGQLGREIIRQLAGGHETVGMDVLPGGGTDVVASVTDREAMFALAHGIEAIIHTASLHAPHVSLRSKQEFVATNITGTLHLLEAAVAAGVRRFVYTSTTSLYGYTLVPTDRAVWVTEELEPRPRDIYDISKHAAEDLCRHFAEARGLPTICLRTSRFYAEEPERVAIHRLYRGADVRDMAAAHVLALTDEHIHFDIFNVSARSPFIEAETLDLLRDAASVIRRHFPKAEAIFARRGWRLPAAIDRVYVIERAERLLGYRPRWNFRELLDELSAGESL